MAAPIANIPSELSANSSDIACVGACRAVDEVSEDSEVGDVETGEDGVVDADEAEIEEDA